MDQVSGELRTVTVTTQRDSQEEQQKVQILSDSSQFGGEYEESITLYLPASPALGKLKKQHLRIPVTIYAKAGVVHRNYWKESPVGIEVRNDKGDFMPLSNRPESLKPASSK